MCVGNIKSSFDCNISSFSRESFLPRNKSVICTLKDRRRRRRHRRWETLKKSFKVFKTREILQLQIC